MAKMITVKYGQPCPNNLPTGYMKERGNYCAGMIACEYCCHCKENNFDKREQKCSLIA